MNAPSCLAIALLTSMALSACSLAKIESRLEANPQCKEIVNPKTGATMPCPGPEQFVRSPASEPSSSPAPAASSASGLSSPIAPQVPRAQPILPCKPQMNTKTGSMMPCPNG